MTCFLLAAALAAGLDPQQTPPTTPAGLAGAHLDGTWTVLFAGRDGQRIGNGQNETVTIHGNVLTWQREGKEHRVHLNFAANHLLSAWPEAAEHREPAHAGTAEQKQTGKVERPAAKAEGSEPKHDAAAQAAPAPGTAPAAAAAPAPVPGTVPTLAAVRQFVQAPGEGQATLAERAPGVPGQPTGARMGAHGVYIDANEFLCLSLSGGFIDERHEPAASTEPKARPPVTAKAPAEKAAASTATPATGTEAKKSQPAASAKNTQGTKEAAQPGNEAQRRDGEPRTANYPAGTESAKAGMHQQGDFVFILRREIGQPRSGQAK
jgi:hypothetical protein